MHRAPWELTREMFLTADEADALRKFVIAGHRHAAPAERMSRLIDRLIIETLLLSGVRCSEFCKLRRADGPTALAGAVLRVGAKGEQRTVWLPTDVAQLVSDFVERLRPTLMERGEATKADGPLFVTERGRPFERTGLYRRVVNILTAAGFGERASVQLLRHTYGYLAYLRTGGNLLFVQRQLGHAHPMITSIYAQFVEEDYATLAMRVAGAAHRAAPLRVRKSRKVNA